VFELLLPVPPTANKLYPTGRNGRRFKSKGYKEWEETASRSLEGQAIPETLLGRLSVEYVFSFKDKRRRDIGNFEKAVSDFLQNIGVFKDDCQIDMLSLVRDEVGENTVHIRIQEIG